MNNLRSLAPAAYLVAFTLFFVPLVDALLGVAPWQLASTQWRFGALGLLSNALMIPSVGALLAAMTSVSLGHARTQRAIGTCSWIIVALLFVIIGLFCLDALQARSLIRSDMTLSYYVAAATAMVKLLLGTAVFAFLGLGARIQRAKPQLGASKPRRDLVSMS